MNKTILIILFGLSLVACGSDDKDDGSVGVQSADSKIRHVEYHSNGAMEQVLTHKGETAYYHVSVRYADDTTDVLNLNLYDDAGSLISPISMDSPVSSTYVHLTHDSNFIVKISGVREQAHYILSFIYIGEYVLFDANNDRIYEIESQSVGDKPELTYTHFYHSETLCIESAYTDSEVANEKVENVNVVEFGSCRSASSNSIIGYCEISNPNRDLYRHYYLEPQSIERALLECDISAGSFMAVDSTNN
ncbi:MAG: hypothetical protein HWE39_13950 [Oceanospirillaceae bacterium]|nr:hypothetical protein [Oceanospirillaceae bacterium]